MSLSGQTHRAFLTIFTTAIDLNSKWINKEPDIVFGVKKDIDGLVSNFN